MNARKPVGYESLIVGEDGRDKEGFLEEALIYDENCFQFSIYLSREVTDVR